MPRHAKGLKRKPRYGAFLLSSNTPQSLHNAHRLR
nr:MAG TPA: hypothetical protein [Caudoviricetes sp.]